MTLDIFALSHQVRAMSEVVRGDATRLPARLAQARQLLHDQAVHWEEWHDKTAEIGSHPPFLIAQPLEPMNAVYDPSICPAEYAVAAADGSHIDAEYHGQTHYCLLNMGTATIFYGSKPRFEASSTPNLLYDPDDLVINVHDGGRKYPLTGSVLTAKRDADEGWALFHAALTLSEYENRLAIQDGTLIRWTLEELDPLLRNHFLEDYGNYLAHIQDLGCPVISYMSQPRSPDVRGLAHFLYANGDLSAWRQSSSEEPDEPFAGIADHLIFSDMLRDGQRSARFASQSRINKILPGQQIQFFYLKVGREVARVEFPAWVAEEGYLDLVHALIYDQTERGMGYPAVVQRAHEQAVIHDADRLQLRTLIDKVLIQAGVSLGQSAKTASKLRPRV